MKHHLRASPETCAWGYFDSTLPPAYEVESGDTIVIDTVSGGPDQTPARDSDFQTPPELWDVECH